jgi:hypothetical protein
LKIREEQLGAFSPVAEAAFLRRVVGHVRRHHADAAVRLPDAPTATTVKQLPEERLTEMVRRGLARARRYGLTLETTLTGFVAIMFAVAPNFDAHPLLRRVLTDETVPPDSRLDEMMSKTSAENWVQVERSYDPDAWLEEA